jgi:hypothetical protein
MTVPYMGAHVPEHVILHVNDGAKSGHGNGAATHCGTQ